MNEPAEVDYYARLGTVEEPAFYLMLGHVVTAPSTEEKVVGSGPKEEMLLPCWRRAFNDKATEQEYKTEKHRHESDVFAHNGKQTQTCHQLWLW